MFFFKLKSPFVLKLFLAVLAGFLLSYSQPACMAKWAVWIALTPLMLLWKICKVKESILYSFITGFLFFNSIHLWGNVFGLEVCLALSLHQSVYLALAGGLASFLLNKFEGKIHSLLIPAVIWTSMEYVKSLGPLGINWGSLSYCHYQNIPIMSLAGITGMYGITFLNALFSSSICISIYIIMTEKKVPIKDFIPSISIIAITLAIYLAGFINLSISDSSNMKSFKVGIIQPAFDMITKKDPRKGYFLLNEQRNLTIECSKQQPKIIIWPETSLPGIYPDTGMIQFMKNIAIEAKCDMIFGVVHIDKDDEYNSAVMMDKKGCIQGTYSKRHLVPFGEYMPIPDCMKKLHPKMSLIPSMSSGKECQIFKIGDIKFASIICFESDFPQYVREETSKGASFIAVITNDGWFENYSVAEHHVAWNAMRSAENHIPIIQSANSGISMLTDSDGKIIKRIELFTKGYMAEDINISKTGTFYTYTGNWIIFICNSYIIILIFVAVRILKTVGKLKKKEANNEKDS